VYESLGIRKIDQDEPPVGGPLIFLMQT